MSSIKAIIEKILMLTRSMMRAAEAAEWDKVQSLQAMRQKLLEDYARLDVKSYDVDEQVSMLNEVNLLNQKMVELAVEAKIELLYMLESTSRGGKAAQAYISNAG